MARYSKVVKQKKKKKSSIIPEKLQAFTARRIYDICAALLFCGGLFTILSILLYNQNDPGWNVAVSGSVTVQNPLGAGGAYIADLFMQTLGLAGAVWGGILSFWGYRMYKRLPLSPILPRLCAFLAAGIAASVIFARIPSFDWVIQPYLGGAGGAMMLDSIAGALNSITNSAHDHIWAVMMTLPVFILAFSYAMCMNRTQWKMITLGFWSGLVYAAQTSFYKSKLFANWVRHYNDPEREEIAAKIEKPQRKTPQISAGRPEAPEENLEAFMPPVSPSIKVVSPSAITSEAKAKPKTTMAKMSAGTNDWELPPLNLLQETPPEVEGLQLDESQLQQNAEMLQNTLSDFNVSGEIVSIHPGPVVTLYELEPAPGVKSQRVISLSDDIARSMSAISVRSAVVPGRNVIGIELPNEKRQTVYLRELLETNDVVKSKAHLPLILGKDIGGKPIIADLAKMPHLLIAGTTGSGKSVAVNTMILSVLYQLPPEKCRLIMIDPKMLELSVYDDIPHLLAPVVTEPGKAVVSLKWAVQEMENRYRSMSKLGVRNIEGYNQRLREAVKKNETLMRKVQTGFDPETGKPVFEDQPMDMTELPYIVIIVDEFADLMLVAGKDVENAVQRLAQMARAAGIHLIMATQRPSVDVITGVIKANFPTRISFQVTSKIDSRTILGEGGAEQLLGMGDMLYMAPGGRITRVHGPFVSDEEVENVVNFLKEQAAPQYLEEVTEGGDFGDSEIMSAMFGEGGGGEGSDIDELYDQAVAIVARERKASTSFIQRHLQIGYNRAARIVEEMERQGVIGPANKVGKRDILVGDYSDA